MNRWLVVVGGVLIQVCLGAIYAWSVFTPSLSAAGWTAAQTQFVFSAGLASFAIVMVAAGYYLMPKLGPRLLVELGGLTLGIGYILAGLVGGTHVVGLILFIGIIGGAGIGGVEVGQRAAAGKDRPQGFDVGARGGLVE